MAQALLNSVPAGAAAAASSASGSAPAAHSGAPDTLPAPTDNPYFGPAETAALSKSAAKAAPPASDDLPDKPPPGWKLGPTAWRNFRAVAKPVPGQAPTHAGRHPGGLESAGQNLEAGFESGVGEAEKLGNPANRMAQLYDLVAKYAGLPQIGHVSGSGQALQHAAAKVQPHNMLDYTARGIGGALSFPVPEAGELPALMGAGASSGAGQYAGGQTGALFGPKGREIGEQLGAGLGLVLGGGGALAFRKALGAMRPEGATADAVLGQHGATGDQGAAKPVPEVAPGQYAAKRLQQIDTAHTAALDAAKREAEAKAASLPAASREAVGQQLRGFVAEADKARHDAASHLFDLAQKNGDLTFPAAPAQQAVAEAKATIDPEAGDTLLPREGRLHDLISRWPDEVPYERLRATRSNVSAAMEEARGDARAMTRLRTLRNGIDDAISSAIDRRAADEQDAVAAGRMNPDDTITNRLRADKTDWSAAGSGEQHGIAGGLGGSGAGLPASDAEGRTTAVPGGAGTAGTAASESAVGRSIPSGDRGLAPGSRLSLKPPPRPESLTDFLIRKGGVRDEGGDMRSMDLHQVHHRAGGRLVNPKGLPLDSARELAEGEGFLRAPSTTNDLLDALGEERAGNLRFRPEDMADAREWRDWQEGARRNEAALANARFDALGAAENLGVKLMPAQTDHAAELIGMHGLDPHDAVMQAVEASDRGVLDHDAQMLAMNNNGMPPSARQSALPLPAKPALAEPAELAPGTPAEREGAARKAWREYKADFGDKTPAAAVLRRGPFGGGHALADEQVARRFLNTGQRSVADARNLKAVLGDDRARVVAREHLGSELRRAAVNDQTGAFNPTKAWGWIKRNSGVLSEFPELRRQFGDVASAHQRVDELLGQQKAERDAFDKSAFRHILASGEDASMALDRILKPRVGYSPAVAMRDLVGELRRDPAALHGLRRAAVEWLADRGLKGEERKIKGPHPLESLVQNNRAALGQLFTGPELDRLQELGRDVGRMRAESAKSSVVKSSLWRVMAKGAAGFVGFHLGDLPGAVAGVLAEHGVEHLLGGRGAFAHGAAQERLLAEAMHDPNVFAALMQPIDTAKPATLNAAATRLARALRKSAVLGATMPQQQGRNGYASGGAVASPFVRARQEMMARTGKLSNPSMVVPYMPSMGVG